MRTIPLVLFLLGKACGLAAANSGPESVSINDQRLRLGSGKTSEWEWFENDPATAPRLDRKFTARSNAAPATLFIRQDDVRQEWVVHLNGRRLGTLHLMEADLIHDLTVPAGALRDGENVLSILPPKENDDIIVREIRLDARPPAEAIAEGALNVFVADTNRLALPCRVSIVDAASGALAPVRPFPVQTNATHPPLAVRPGVVYMGPGRMRVGLPAGAYILYASRGFEWSVATQRVQIVRGETATAELVLRQEVSTPGLVGCDTHVHTFTHSRHGDSTMEERMLTLAGEGIELPVATDHNLHIDYTAAAQATQMDRWFTPVVGNEVTTPAGHFNIFPVQAEARVPDFKLTDWPRLMTALRGTPDVRVVVLNHPRNVHSQFQPFAATNFNPVTGENLRGPEFTFDAMELLNSSAQQSDHLLVLRDWFALLNYGYRITAVGSSDSHDVSRYIVGQGRTYIACPDTNPGRLDIAMACSNLVAGRAWVSMGLLAQLIVNDRYGAGDLAVNLGDDIGVEVRVLGPSWITATNVTVFANGAILSQRAIAPEDAAGPGLKMVWQFRVPRPPQDMHWVVMATGPDMPAPFWAIPKPYQPTSSKWTGRVIAASNPTWIDADADGRFTAARGYARQLIARHGSDPRLLLPALARFDEATASQAASLSAAAGVAIDSDSFRRALAETANHVRRGFEAFLATRR